MTVINELKDTLNHAIGGELIPFNNIAARLTGSPPPRYVNIIYINSGIQPERSPGYA
jgi:hypothetical protein